MPVYTKERLRETLRSVYRTEMDKIFSEIQLCNGKLTERKFDQIFGDYVDETLPNGDMVRHPRKPSIKVWPYGNGKAWILGGIGSNDWSRWLDLTQIMCRAGVLSAIREDDGIVYRIVKLI